MRRETDMSIMLCYITLVGQLVTIYSPLSALVASLPEDGTPFYLDRAEARKPRTCCWECHHGGTAGHMVVSAACHWCAIERDC